MNIKTLKIGNIELNNNILLAPMAGITDLPFRLMCEKFNPGLVCTEMVSAQALFYGDEKTKKLLNIEGEKRPLAIQIFGSDVESMKFAAKYVSNIADIIDINMGCPAPKIVKNGDGSKLLLNLDLAGQIISEVVKVSRVPVTVKFRKGWNSENIVACEMAQIAQDSGASAVTIHGRTRQEYYSGVADWDIIKRVKNSVRIPVIGNGDIRSPEDALRMFEETGVDGVMIGRGAIGKPWIFKQVNDFFNIGKYDENFPSKEERLNIILEHFNLEVKEKGENVGIKEMRKHLAYYVKNLKDASTAREKLNRLNTYSEVRDCLVEYFNNN